MFEIKEPSTTKVKIYGKEYDLKKPSVRQIKLISAQVESMKNNSLGATEAMIKFVADLGIEAEVLEEMSAEHFNTLVEHIVGAKKN